jgi:peroxiredoxin
VKRKATKIIIVGFVLFALVLSSSGCLQEPQTPSPLKVGDKTPRFTLPDLQGNKITMPDDCKGKVVIIRFWADWCTSCAREMPAIDYVYHKYRERGLTVLAVNVGQSREIAQAFVKNLKISYPVLLDTYSMTSKQYEVKVLPVTLIIDKKGVIRTRFIGETGREAFEDAVTDLL